MDVCSQILTSWRDWRVWSGGEDVLRELMAILETTAQEIVSLTRFEFRRRGGLAAHAAGVGGQRPDTTAANIAEVVMGSEAWTIYKNSAYKSMKGPRKPEGSVACKKRTKERRLKLGSSLAGWTLQHKPEHFAGTDTHWTMDQTLTWLPPDGDVNNMHLETLGNMISEAFHQHKTKIFDAKNTVKKASTAAEALDWNGVTSVHGADFFKPRK